MAFVLECLKKFYFCRMNFQVTEFGCADMNLVMLIRRIEHLTHILQVCKIFEKFYFKKFEITFFLKKNIFFFILLFYPICVNTNFFRIWSNKRFFNYKNLISKNDEKQLLFPKYSKNLNYCDRTKIFKNCVYI